MAHVYKLDASISEADILEVVLTGNETRIRKFVEYSLPLAKPLDNKSDSNSSIVTPQVQEALLAALRKCPPATRQLFRSVLNEKGVYLAVSDVDEVYDAVMKSDLMAIRHWVRSIEMDGCAVDAFGRLVRLKHAEIAHDFVERLIKVNARASRVVSEFLLDELCKRGIFLPEDRPTPILPDVGNAAAVSSSASGGGVAAAAAGGGVSGGARDPDDEPEPPQRFDFTKLVVRLARNNLLFRPRPPRPEHAFMDNLAPFGSMSPLHYFVVSYLSEFDLKAATEAYAAWYKLSAVNHRLFATKRPELLRPSVTMVRELFERGMAEAGLGAGLVFQPRRFDPDSKAERGIFQYVEGKSFESAVVRYEYLAPLMARIDLQDMRPSYQRVERSMADFAELRLGLQHAVVPRCEEGFVYAVPENLQGSKADATLFSYLLGASKLNPDAFFAQSKWVPRIDLRGTPQRLAEAEEEERAMVSVRDWLRHRAAVSATYAVFTTMRPRREEVWDSMAVLAARVALANFVPTLPPRAELDDEQDEFDRRKREQLIEDSFGRKVKQDAVEREVLATAMHFVDMITWRDTVDSPTLSMYLEAAEVFAHFRPLIFGTKKLMLTLDAAFTAGRARQKEFRRAAKFQGAEVGLVTIKQLPAELRRVFFALGEVFSKDTETEAEKKRVLRLLTIFFVAYRVQFSENLVARWKKLEGGATAPFVRWLLALASVFRVPPEPLLVQLTFSSGLFALRGDVLEQTALLVGTHSGLLPAYRPRGNEDVRLAPIDKTTHFLSQIPALVVMPREGVREAQWLGDSLLRRALQSITGGVPADALLPSLALDLGSTRLDCFMTQLLMDEAAYVAEENKLKHPDQRIECAPRESPNFSQREMEETLLRLCSFHRYMVVLQALRLFYPNCALVPIVEALLAVSRGQYSVARELFIKLATWRLDPQSVPAGFHLVEDSPAWTEEMTEEVLRSGVGIESELPAPSNYDNIFLRDLFAGIKFTPGVKVMDELANFHNPVGKNIKGGFSDSERLFEEKMAELREFTSPIAFLWEFRNERARFYTETEDYFVNNGASPVVIGAWFFSVWAHFKYREKRSYAEIVDAKEEVQQLLYATSYWSKCDREVYGEVVHTLSARVYCLLLAHDLDGVSVRIGKRDQQLRLSAFFPPSRLSNKPRKPQDPSAEAVKAAAEAVNRESWKRPDFTTKENQYSKEEMANAMDMEPSDREMKSKEDAAAAAAAAAAKGQPASKDGGKPAAQEGKSGEEVDEEDDPFAADHLEEEMAKQLAEMEQERKKREEEEKSGMVMERMDLAGFLVYQPLRRTKYMPDALRWEERWRREEEVERDLMRSGLSPDEARKQAAAKLGDKEADGAGAGAGADGGEAALAALTGKDKSGMREMDLELFVEVMDKLLRRGSFQQAFNLANDILNWYPQLFESMLPELKSHLERLRVVFYVAGIDKITSKDLGLRPAEERKGADAKRPAWRRSEPPRAAQFANITWLPDSTQTHYVVVNRKRVAWDSQTKVSAVRYLMLTQFPRVDVKKTKKVLDEDKAKNAYDGAIAVLEEYKKHDRELAGVVDLFVVAMRTRKQEEAFGRKVTLPEVLARLVEPFEEGTLSLFMEIRDALRASLLTVLEMPPQQVVYELMQRRSDLRLIKLYLRVCAPNPSPLPVQYLVQAYTEYLERRVESELKSLNEQKLEREKKVVNLQGQEWADAQARINEDYYRASLAVLSGGWVRNRLIAFAGCAAERRQMGDLGRLFLETSRTVDITAAADMRGMSSVEALEVVKFELLYAAYFAYFAAAHLSGLKLVLQELDRVLLELKPKPHRFKLFAQRTLFLTGEYKSLPRSVGVAIQTHRSAATRAKVAQEARNKMARHDEAMQKAAAEREADDEKKAEPGDADDEEARVGAEALADKKKVSAVEGLLGKGALGAEDEEALEAAEKDDVEVDLANTRYSLVLAIVNVMQGLEGYALFLELESVAASFKDLAWRYQELNWFRQAVDCHRISDLVNIEMEYVPVKLRRFNFVDPDEHEFNQMWKHYTSRKPRSSPLKEQVQAGVKLPSPSDLVAADENAGDDAYGAARGVLQRGASGSVMQRDASLLGQLGAKGGKKGADAGEGEDSDEDEKKQPAGAAAAAAAAAAAGRRKEQAGEAGELAGPSMANLLSQEQLEMLIGDSILSSVDGRYLERVRREFAHEARRLQKQGKAPGRVYKELHSLIARAVAHFKEVTRGEPLTKDELKALVVGKGPAMVEFDPTHDHQTRAYERLPTEQKKYPATVLFVNRDRFGKWNLGIDATNNVSASEALRILSNLRQKRQAQLFKDYYFGEG